MGFDLLDPWVEYEYLDDCDCGLEPFTWDDDCPDINEHRNEWYALLEDEADV